MSAERGNTRVDNSTPIPVELGEGVVMRFLPMPAGKFRMGQRGMDADEEPLTEVEVPEFWIGETPVTQEQYRVMAEACLKELSAIEGNRGSEPSSFKDREDSAQRPVENVNWHEARVVAGWLMGKMHDAGTLPPGYVVDLPPEALWEYACRAGTDTEYWSGDGDAALAQVGWFRGNADGATHPVGEKNQPNTFGLHDMHGNVGEWCMDFYEVDSGRLRLPAGLAVANVNRPRPSSVPSLPALAIWARLFNRIKAGGFALGGQEILEISSLSEIANSMLNDGEASWAPVAQCCKAALSDGHWPEDRMGIAEGLWALFQGRVDASSNSSLPERILRGGSWFNSPRDCRSAFRSRVKLNTSFRSGTYGFRLCVFSSPARQGPDAEPEAESARVAKARRDDAAVADLDDGAQVGAWDDAKLPPRGGEEIF